MPDTGLGAGHTMIKGLVPTFVELTQTSGKDTKVGILPGLG